MRTGFYQEPCSLAFTDDKLYNSIIILPRSANYGGL